jgi:hypothetical protein
MITKVFGLVPWVALTVIGADIPHNSEALSEVSSFKWQLEVFRCSRLVGQTRLLESVNQRESLHLINIHK